MKPYEERLTLIDEAIYKLGGKPDNATFSFLNGYEYLWKNESGEYCWAMKGSPAYRRGEVFCTKQEFEQRVKDSERVRKNDWYEKGEMPHIGEKVAYENTVVEVLFHDQKLPQVCVRHGDGQLSVLAVSWLKPLRTEEGELVAKFADDLFHVGRHGLPYCDLIKLAEDVVKAGWRPTEGNICG
jgi:hypothetical protein